MVSRFEEGEGLALREGVDLELLPDVPLYSGHIHTPQVVGKLARYVGSLYQTSVAEAHQRKCLYTISRSLDFDVVEVQECAVGPRHFPVQDPRLLPPPDSLRRFDRVLLLPKATSFPVIPESCEDADGIMPLSLSSATSMNWSSNGRNVLEDKTALSADALLRLSTAYRRSGVLFECRITPEPSTSVAFHREATTRETETQEVTTPSNAGSPGLSDILPVDYQTPLEALRLYVWRSPQDDRPTVSQRTLAAAEAILQEQLEGVDITGAGGPARTVSAGTLSETMSTEGADLILRVASIESFGVFSGFVRFDLYRRGSVLLEGTGDVLDGNLLGGNGAGKSTLMQAVVWALTGDGDPGSFTATPGRTKVTGVVCDDVPLFPGSLSGHQVADEIEESRRDAAGDVTGDVGSHSQARSLRSRDPFASVELKGELNGESFLLRRSRWRSGSSELTLHIGRRNATCQSVADTQRELEAFFGGRLKAWSQFLYLSTQGADGLLRISEASFLDILTLLLPLGIWTAATAAARLKQRVLMKAANALDLVATVRSRDLQRLLSRQTYRDPQTHQARRLQRLVALLRSRAALNRSQQALMTAAEELMGPQGVQRHLLCSVLRQLEAQTNIYLDAASGGLLRLDFRHSRSARLSKVLGVRGSDGAFRERTLQQASSGQRQLLGLCLFLALIVTIKRRTGLRSNILFLDEPFLSLDTVNTYVRS